MISIEMNLISPGTLYALQKRLEMEAKLEFHNLGITHKCQIVNGINNIFSLLESELRFDWVVVFDPVLLLGNSFGNYSHKNDQFNYILLFAFRPALPVLRIHTTVCPQWYRFILKILHQQ